MAIQHPDAEVNFLIQTLEGQRDTAIVCAAQAAKQVAECVTQIQALTKEVADLKTMLEAAAKFQGEQSNVIPISEAPAA